MDFLLILLLFAVLEHRDFEASASCDRHLEPVVDATLEWAGTRAAEGGAARLFVESGLEELEALGRLTPAERMDAAIVAEVARRNGIAVGSRSHDAEWRQCSRDSTSASCGEAARTAAIRLSGLSCISPVAARANVRIWTLTGAQPPASWAFGELWEVQLEFDGETWRVNEATRTVVLH